MGLILVLFIQNARSRAALFSSPINLLLLAGAAVLVVALLILSLLLARHQAASLTAAPLQTAQGVVRLEQEYSPNSAITSYHVFIGEQRFSFSEEMSQVFQEGRKARVYYCHSGPYQLILSIEALPQ